MKITYIKLENFIGIFNGMNKYSIEIDFTKVNSDNNIVLFQGSNGTGKSCLLSTLHPFSGTMDDRSEIILPNENGYKEIHIQNGSDEYVIKHHYFNKKKTKQIKSYISKNGEELNDNGTVRSFEEIVKNELDVVPSFFILSRIGSNVKNFIGLKPAERKNYMSKFLPDVSLYLEEYKKINEKYLSINKKIKSVTAEIAKLDDEENLKSTKTSLTKNLKLTKKNMDKILEKINMNKGILATMDVDKIEETHDNAKEKIRKATKNIKILNEAFSSNVTDLIDDGDISYSHDDANIDNEEFIEFLNETLSNLRKNLIKYKEDLSSNIALSKKSSVEIEELKKDISKLKKDLNSYKMEKDIDEFKEMLSEYENNLKIINKKIKNFDDKYKLDIEDEDVNILMQFFKHIQDDVVFSGYDAVTVDDYLSNRYELSALKDDIEKKTKTLNKIKKSINACELKITELSSKLKLKDILSNRPSSCKIDSCKFISEALKYANVDEEINKLEESLDDFNTKDTQLSKEIDHLTKMYDYGKNIRRLYKEVIAFSGLDNLKRLIPDRFDSLDHFMDFIPCDKNLYIDEFQKAIDYSHLFMDKRDIDKMINEISHNIELLKSKDTLIKKISLELDEKTNRLSDVLAENRAYKESISENTELSENTGSVIFDLEDCIEYSGTYDKSVTVLNKYTEVLNKLKDDTDKINSINEESEVLLKEYKDLSDNYDSLDTQLDDIKYKLKRLDEFKNDLKYLNERYENVGLVRNALSPTKGIPLLFVDVYLKKTRDIANRLLDVAYNGKFYIEDFELTDSDFFIKVIKEDGVPVKDVTLTSQGETALIGIAISFAMIQQAEKNYNIILLDEVDKELDSGNRSAFVSIIQKQLEIMNVEQCFIISHNKEFDNANLDLLLFPNYDPDILSDDYLENKNIIYRYE